MAATAVQQLRAAGFPAARLEVGYPEWLTATRDRAGVDLSSRKGPNL